MPKAELPGVQVPVVDQRGMLTGVWAKFFHQLSVRIGASRTYNLGGTLTVDTTAVGNVGSGEDNLMTYSILRNSLSSTSDHIEIVAFGTFAANANNKTLKLYLGSTLLFSTGAIAANAKDWELRSSIIRTGEATQICSTACFTSTALVANLADYVTGTEDFTSDITIKCTGEATSTDDIIQKGLIIKLFPRG